jgi:integrase
MRGQIIEKSKGVWLVRVESKRGKERKSTSKTVRGTKRDAEKFLTAWLRDIDKGVFVEPSRQTLNEHLDEWLKIIRPRIAEQTFGGYKRALRVHIRPRVGELQLMEVKILTVQKIYVEMQESGLSPRTVRSAHTVLSMALKKAVELGYIANNPCGFAELPKQNRTETKAFSPEQAYKFLEKAKGDRHGLIFELALICGMRPEEYLALQWKDIDFERCTATVQRALVWLNGGGFKFAETKTAKSRRTMPFPKQLALKLKEHKRRQTEHRFKLGAAYENLDLVFANEIGKPHHYGNLRKRHFEKILKEAGLETGGFVLYSLRHSCATLLLSAGENPKIVAERLGHSSVKMTLDTYSHVLPDMQQAASEKLERMLYS